MEILFVEVAECGWRARVKEKAMKIILDDLNSISTPW